MITREWERHDADPVVGQQVEGDVLFGRSGSHVEDRSVDDAMHSLVGADSSET